MLGYLSADIICSEKRTVFQERSSRKTVSFEEQIMSKDKYPSIFSRQMKAIVYISHWNGLHCRWGRHWHLSIGCSFYSIAWCHRLAGLQVCSPNHSLIKGTLEGVRRMIARPVHLEESLSFKLIERINDAYSRTESLTVHRLLFILLVGYAGIFRFNEIQGLRVMDLSIYIERMSVFNTAQKWPISKGPYAALGYFCRSLFTVWTWFSQISLLMHCCIWLFAVIFPSRKFFRRVF